MHATEKTGDLCTMHKILDVQGATAAQRCKAVMEEDREIASDVAYMSALQIWISAFLHQKLSYADIVERNGLMHRDHSLQHGN